MILNLNLSDMDGVEFIKTAKYDSEIEFPNVIIYSNRELSEHEQVELAKYSGSIIIKSAKSHERILDEVHLFANQVSSELSQSATAEVSEVEVTPDILEESELEGKVILIVDDDMRNTFALAKVLRKNKLEVKLASSGAQSLTMLAENNEIELVVMDIMMPEMDGYETIRHIRENKKLEKLPVIAVTANAMPGDKEKCFEAGANDYLPKPVDVAQLLTMMKLWL